MDGLGVSGYNIADLLGGYDEEGVDWLLLFLDYIVLLYLHCYCVLFICYLLLFTVYFYYNSLLLLLLF